MKVVSLFSGCGGLDYGLHQAGHEIILQCENDPGAQQVLKTAFPGTLLAPDIVALSSLPPETEMLAAGFPCIDVSRAGLRRGLDGPSTGLVRHVFRLLERAAADHRPVPWVLLENVEALLDRRQDGPPVVAWLAQRFEALGYRSWAHRVVCSAGFGVPNRRKRVFMVASMHGDARDVLLAQGAHRCMGACMAAHGADCWECFDPDDVKGDAKSALNGCSYALDLGNARSAAGVDVVPTFTTSNDRMCLLLSSGRYGLLTIDDAERLQGLPVGHTLSCAAPEREGERETREAERRRFQLLGNAVTTQVARWIGERLAAPYRFKYLQTDLDAPLPQQYQAEGLTDGALEDVNELRMDKRLGSGAVAGQGLLQRRPAPLGGGLLASVRSGGLGAAAAASGAAPAASTDGSSGDDGGRTPGAVGGAPGGGAARLRRMGGGGARGAAGEGADEEGEQGGEEEEEGAEEEREGDEGGAPVPFQDITGQSLRRSSRARAAPSRRVERYQSAGALFGASWPKAAWFVEGQGRWGVAGMSECPLKLAFVPLGSFIHTVGARPPDVSVITYLQRLKEQGWDVTRTERKLLMCGGDDAAAIMRVLGMGDVPLEHSASIGQLGWATERPLNPAWAPKRGDPEDPAAAATPAAAGVPAADGAPAATAPAPAAAASPAEGGAAGSGWGSDGWALGVQLPGSRRLAAGPWWPCEVVDPWRPPMGFLFLLDHMTALDEHERRMYVPGDVTRGVAKAAVWSAADAAGFGAPPPGPRKLLVLWLGLGKFEWRFEWELLPFEPFLEEMAGQASRLEAAGKLTRRLQFHRGLQDAKEALALQKGWRERAGLGRPGDDAALAAALAAASRGGGETLRDAAAARAARQANAANSLPRCQVCEACTQCTGATHRRRCLVMRAAAAAAGGHAGAQLAVMGEAAVGARVSVWWPMDGQWFAGQVTAYDRLRVRHTVEYEDGDVEILPLWGPQQRIRLASRPEDWGAEAAKLAARREEAGRKLAQAKARQAEATNVLMAGAPTTVLEAQRAANIARNNEKLRALGLQQKAVQEAADQEDPDFDAAAAPAPEAAARAAAGGRGAAPAAPAGGSKKRVRSKGRRSPAPAASPANGAGAAGEAGRQSAAATPEAAGGREGDPSSAPEEQNRSATSDAPQPPVAGSEGAAAAGDEAGQQAAKRRKAGGGAGAGAASADTAATAAAGAAGLPPRPPSARSKGRAK